MSLVYNLAIKTSYSEVSGLLTLILADLFSNAFLLFWILAYLVILLVYTFVEPFSKSTPFKSTFANIRAFRIYLLCLIALVLITIIYWAVDAHIIDVPNPAVPYAFFILAITINFGFRVAFITSILSAGLIDFYLYEPRYHIFQSQHFFSELVTLIGLVISLVVGSRIRSYEQLLKKSSDELRLLIKMRDQFTSIAAHDLKNPLTTIRLYSEMLSKNLTTKKASSLKTAALLKVSTETIRNETDKLLEMINRLLDFSRLQQGKFDLKIERIDLLKVCQQKIKIMKIQYPTHKFKLVSSLKKATILADKISVDRVLTNLLINAVKYSKEGLAVKVSIEPNKHFYLVEIADEGVGVEKQSLNKLFEPFFQAHGTKKGLGLGLYIVKQLVELNKGNIWVESEYHKGTSFFISFPKTGRH